MNHPINLLLWNANGLSARKKQTINTAINIFNPNIVLIVESHMFTDFNYKNWKIHNFPKIHKGFVIAFNPSVVKFSILQTNERWIKFTISQNKKLLKGILIYGFTKKEKIQIDWWKNLNLREFDIILGDFNMTLSNEDRINTRTVHLPCLRECVAKELQEHIDIARRFKNLSMTFYKNFEPISRIDYIFVANERAYLVDNYLNIPNPLGSDHSMLFCSLRLNKKKPTSKHFRNHLFNSTFYQDELSACINKTANACSSWPVFKKTIIDDLAVLQKEIHRRTNKTKYKIINLLKKIPKNKSKSRLKLITILNQILEEEGNYNRAKQSFGDSIRRDNPSDTITSKLKPFTNENIKQINVNGSVVTKTEEIKEGFVHFYASLYNFKPSSDELLKHVLKNVWEPPNIDYSELIAKITPDEITQTIKSFSSFKASGPDGLPYKVYKTMNKRSINVLCNFFNQVLVSGKIPDDWKESNITTFHKSGDPLLISNRRPISLLNSDYKIFSKIMTNRLNIYLQELIGYGQVGFVPGRSPADNILLLDTLLQDKKNIIINLDFKKAYDSVAHNAIIIILSHLQFPKAFVDLIEDLLHNCSSQILINGSLSRPFLLERGVRQGDIISPSLFTLVIELLQKIAIKNCLQLHSPIINNMVVPPLMFADDVTICTTQQEGIDRWGIILRDFQLMTGLEINLEKTTILSNINITSPYKNVQNFRYLGINFDHNGISNNSEERVNSIIRNLNAWHNPGNSIFQKITILKTYALSKLTYDGFFNNVDTSSIKSAINDFLWKTKSRKKKIYVSKFRTENPPHQGGLGMWNLDIRLQALKASTLEKIRFNDDSKMAILWRDLLKPVNIMNTDLDAPLTFKRFHSAWLRSFSRQDDATQINFELQNYRPIKIIYQNLLENFDSTAEIPKIKWTPRQTKISKYCNLKRLFSNIFKFRNRRHAFFMWKYLQGGLPFNHTINCPLCKTQKLSYIHIFYECPSLRDTYRCIILFIRKISPSFPFKINKKHKSLLSIQCEWNENVILKILSLSDSVHPIPFLAAASLNAIWIIYNKLSHEESTDPKFWLSQELNFAISCLYFIMLQNSTLSSRPQDKKQFFDLWKIPMNWSKCGKSFLPKL